MVAMGGGEGVGCQAVLEARAPVSYAQPGISLCTDTQASPGRRLGTQELGLPKVEWRDKQFLSYREYFNPYDSIVRSGHVL